MLKIPSGCFPKTHTLPFGRLCMQNAGYVFHIFTNSKASLLYMQCGCVIYTYYASNLGKKNHTKTTVNMEIIP